MTIAWTTDYHSNQIFTHEGWTVRIWAGDKDCPPRIEVNSPQSGEEVRVDVLGIEVNGGGNQVGGTAWPSPSPGRSP